MGCWAVRCVVDVRGPEPRHWPAASPLPVDDRLPARRLLAASPRRRHAAASLRRSRHGNDAPRDVADDDAEALSHVVDRSVIRAVYDVITG